MATIQITHFDQLGIMCNYYSEEYRITGAYPSHQRNRQGNENGLEQVKRQPACARNSPKQGVDADHGGPSEDGDGGKPDFR